MRTASGKKLVAITEFCAANVEIGLQRRTGLQPKINPRSQMTAHVVGSGHMPSRQKTLQVDIHSELLQAYEN